MVAWHEVRTVSLVLVVALGVDARADPSESGAPTPPGSRQVFHQAYVKASNPAPTDKFGAAISIQESVLLVGAPLDDDPPGGGERESVNSGAAYIFERNGELWTQHVKLKASAGDSNDRFGSAVAMDGDTLVVGAPLSGPESGSVVVFERRGSTWSEQAVLTATSPGYRDFFGSAVAISGDTIVVGASQEDSVASGVGGDETSNDLEDSGAAYVFVRDGAVWTQQAYLKASVPGAGDLFGNRVSICGDTVVVGARWEDSAAIGIDGDQSCNAAAAAGAAYVFVRDRAVWTQQAYLKASNTGSGDLFGNAVSVSGETIVVGARGEKSAATGADGDQTNNDAPGSGAVYVFTRNDSTWSQQAYLKASNTAVVDQFGYDVSLDGDLLAVGTPLEDSASVGVDGDEANNGAPDSGCAFLFQRNDGVWAQKAYLKASNTGGQDYFGLRVDLSGSSVVVGAPSEDSGASDQSDAAVPDSGAAYVFVLGDPPAASGDLNADGVVDALDLGLLLASWNEPDGDLSGDGVTGDEDLAILLGGWTAGVEPR